MAKKNKTVLIVVGVAAAAGVAYLLLKKSTPAATTQLPPGYHYPTPNVSGGSGSSVLSSVTDLFSSVLKNASVQNWLSGLFQSENSSSGTFTAGGNDETPKLPGYLDYTGNETTYNV